MKKGFDWLEAEKSFSVASFCALANFQSVVAIQDDPHFINTLHPNTSVCEFSILFFYISKGANKKNLFHNQELL